MELLQKLARINRWWTTGRVDSVFLPKAVRAEFNDVISKLSDRRITAIVGPRRVGKSTLITQAIHHLLQGGTDPKRIIFFSCDDPMLFMSSTTIDALLDAYASELLYEDLFDLTEPIYVFIDEIHAVENWARYLKAFHDRRVKAKFVVSGSSSAHLFQGTHESLLGRIEEIKVLPLSFAEFTTFHGVYRSEPSLLELPPGSCFDNPEEYVSQLKPLAWQLDAIFPQANKLLQEYLLVGGYPEYFETDSLLAWQKRLAEDIVSRGLYRDIVTVFKVKNPEILERLIYLIAENSTHGHAYATLAANLGVDTVTVSSYLSYLSQAFLITVQESFSTNMSKIIRKNKKLSVVDNGLRNALLKIDHPTPTDTRLLAEGMVVQMARAYAERNLYTVYYWRQEQKEVDIVIDKKATTVGIEVKYRNQITASDLKGLRAFSTQYSPQHLLVVTKDKLAVSDGIAYVPLWLLK
ncbi:MAG: ATP-binding protein [Bacillota bacterium]|nr:ATP-binding protein [Bacillota bacterium]